MKSQAIEIAMNKILSSPSRYRLLRGTVESCSASIRKVKALTEQAEIELEKIQELSEQIESFLQAEDVDFEIDQQLATAAEARMSTPKNLDPKRLPAVQPRKNYEKLHAILKACIAREGMTAEEITKTWRDLAWRGSDAEDLTRIVRDALRTAQRTKKDIQHTGGRNGKYRILA